MHTSPNCMCRHRLPILYIRIHIHMLRHAHGNPCTPHPHMHLYRFSFHICKTDIKHLPYTAVRIKLNETIHLSV